MLLPVRGRFIIFKKEDNKMKKRNDIPIELYLLEKIEKELQEYRKYYEPTFEKQKEILEYIHNLLYLLIRTTKEKIKEINQSEA